MRVERYVVVLLLSAGHASASPVVDQRWDLHLLWVDWERFADWGRHAPPVRGRSAGFRDAGFVRAHSGKCGAPDTMSAGARRPSSSPPRPGPQFFSEPGGRG